MNSTRLWALAAVITLAACAQNSASGPPYSPAAGAPGASFVPLAHRSLSNTGSLKIQHVVIIVQENRTTNDLFNGFPGADTVLQGTNSKGQTVALKPRSLTAPYDISHTHSAFLTEWANGQGNGWDLVHSHCNKNKTCPPADVRAFGYVPRREVKPYFTMARQYAFADQMFETNQGPSFPAHQYILSGTSTISNGSNLRASENPNAPKKGQKAGGCDSPQGSTVELIDQYGQENQTAYPCFDRISLIQLIDSAGLSWHYYQAHFGPGLWEAPDAILPVFKSSEFSADVAAPPSAVLDDVSAGKLADVVWVTPTGAESDHAGITDGTGPSWVASVVNAIGESKYWNTTAIFVTWDDWGGWFDPVAPQILNSYELGFRVPLIVISPYAKQHYVSHVQHEFASVLKFTEENFSLGSMGTTDVRADDLADCFNFNQKPRKFERIPAPLGAGYFRRQPISNQDPDDDF